MTKVAKQSKKLEKIINQAKIELYDNLFSHYNLDYETYIPKDNFLEYMEMWKEFFSSCNLCGEETCNCLEERKKEYQMKINKDEMSKKIIEIEQKALERWLDVSDIAVKDYINLDILSVAEYQSYVELNYQFTGECFECNQMPCDEGCPYQVNKLEDEVSDLDEGVSDEKQN